MDFKVGDKVKIFGTSYGGKLGTVVDVTGPNQFPFGVKLFLMISGKRAPGIRWFRSREIEKA